MDLLDGWLDLKIHPAWEAISGLMGVKMYFTAVDNLPILASTSPIARRSRYPQASLRFHREATILSIDNSRQ